MKRKTIISAYLADAHIGNENISPEETREILKKEFLNNIKAIPLLDVVCILGDFTHRKLNAGDPYNLVAVDTVSELYKMSKRREHKFAIIMIDGTRSHEEDQLDQFMQYEDNDDGVYFRVVKTYEVLENVNGLKKILCLPHKQISDKEEIEKFFNDKYDLVIGHGLLDQMKFFSQASENQPVKDYTYSLDDLHKIAKGPIYFGHVHPHTRFKRFCYVGSFNLLERGHEGNHGMMVCAQMKDDTSKYVDSLIPNFMTKNYINIQISKTELKECTVQQLVDKINDALKDAESNDLISINIIADTDMQSSDKVFIIRDAYKKDPRIRINVKIKADTAEQKTERNEGLKKRYGYILDQNINADDIIFRYLSEDVIPNIEIPSDIIIDQDVVKKAIS